MIQPLNDPPRQLSYLLKSYWPSRWRGSVEDGRVVKARAQRRLPPRWEAALLVKLDQARLQDLTLMSGLRVTKHGFTMNDEA